MTSIAGTNEWQISQKKKKSMENYFNSYVWRHRVKHLNPFRLEFLLHVKLSDYPGLEPIRAVAAVSRSDYWRSGRVGAVQCSCVQQPLGTYAPSSRKVFMTSIFFVSLCLNCAHFRRQIATILTSSSSTCQSLQCLVTAIQTECPCYFTQPV
jgi:hypothetical protein